MWPDSVGQETHTPYQIFVASSQLKMSEGHFGFTDTHFPAVLNCMLSEIESLLSICRLQERILL